MSGKQLPMVPSYSAGCGACGDCCRAISFGSGRTKTAIMRDWDTRCAAHPDEFDDYHATTYAFIARHWHRISRAEAIRQLPRLGEVAGSIGARYRCDQFDETTNRCLAGDAKPPICREFPWYGGEPSAGSLWPYPRCSYWREIPRDQWPEGVEPCEPQTEEAE